MVPERCAPVLAELQALAEQFVAAGHQLYLVGGTVRDLLLGRDITRDYDCTTDALPGETKRILSDWADAVWTQANDLTGLHPLLRLPLAELSFPALRQRSSAERSTVVSQVMSLIQADGRITPYEYCLSRLVIGELNESMQPQSGSFRPNREVDA